MENFKKPVIFMIVGIIFFLAFLIVIGSFFVLTAKRDLYSEKVQFLTEVSIKNADIIENKVSNQLNTLEAIAAFAGNYYTFNIDDDLSLLSLDFGKNNFKKIGIISLDGEGKTIDGYKYDFFDFTCFNKALNGESNVSDRIIDKADGQEINIFTTPIYKNGTVAGVIFATQNTSVFTEFLEVNSFNDEGYSYIIKSNGTPVVNTLHKNSIGKYDNLFDEISKIKSNKKNLLKFIDDMKNNKDGAVSFIRDDIKKQIGYSKVGINDWYMITVVPSKVISKGSDRLITGMVVTVVLILISALILGATILRIFKRNNNNLKAIAYTDFITGCPNWNKFTIDCRTLLTQNPDKEYAMIIFDVDKFKIINDLYGRNIGNEVLIHIAYVLSLNTREEECFARASADNFNILMEYKTDVDIINRIKLITAQIANYISSYIIELSFGIFKIEDKMLGISKLSEKANFAKLVAKQKTEFKYVFYNENMRDIILKEKEIENYMEVALLNKEFEVYLQPKYRIKDEKVVGAEALIRWNWAGKGIIPPGEFIPIFEKNGFIKKIDLYMFEQVCLILNKWKSNNLSLENSISVNISRIHLSNKNLPEELLSIAKKHNVNANNMEIELTESAVFEDINKLIKIMKKLKNEGFILSIDDFGSGYSSLSTLKDLPADVLKLDKGFLEATTDDIRGKDIISSFIKMTKILGLHTVAEGVETVEQVNFLKSAGCDIAQGYYYSKPLPVKEFERLVFNLISE
ncbi:bifunctional diguanylate cyclase/phosphodiesterase [Anaerovorax odorimutans]|uniref:bifunctional diguanylate cyclase/phosphodiesterase n=1 Tax=Anaerovorax odorimutans TaxID=109327 RepID=UPI000406FCC2|nr:EAL domain-containing protein [Anaerovorax odorimutans]